MAYWIGQPGSYRVKVRVDEQRQGAKRVAMSLDYGLQVEPEKTVSLPTRGSIVLLHPWGTEGSVMTLWGGCRLPARVTSW